MSSGWFNPTEPPRTIAQDKEPDMWWSLTSVQGGSTLPILLEPIEQGKDPDLWWSLT